MATAPGNNIYVADEPGNVQGADPGAVWVVNLDTGKQTLLSHGGLLDHPQDIAIEPTGDREADILSLTARFTAVIEAQIRADPTQWFWIHDRWRHRHGSRGHGADHVVPMLVSPSLTVPVLGGELTLGTWQSIALLDPNADNPERSVVLSFLAG